MFFVDLKMYKHVNYIIVVSVYEDSHYQVNLFHTALSWLCPNETYQRFLTFFSGAHIKKYIEKPLFHDVQGFLTLYIQVTVS